MDILRGITAGLLIALSAVVLCVPLYLLGVVRLLTAGRWRRRLSRAMDGVVQLWVAGNRLNFALLDVTRVHARFVDEAVLSRRGWYLVLSNHQSWADILILQNLLWRRVPLLKFFTKRELIWIPAIGLAMWFLGFPLVRRFSRERLAAEPHLAEVDRSVTQRACRRFREHPTTVLSFIEGSRFTTAKRDAQDSRFQRLLNPKLGGVSYVVEALKDRLDGVLDVTLVYRDGVPTFWDLLRGRCRDVDVLVECHRLPADIAAAPDVAAVRERLRPWVEARWQAKDQRLNGTGSPAG